MELEWTDVMHYQQQMQRLIRLLLPQKPGRLTASEWELLSWLYLQPGQNRPMQLSQCSGMKKEAVSRCLKSLSEKGYIAKQPQPGDERSYCLSLTPLGLEELKNQCEANLDPYYDLLRQVGSDFVELLAQVDRVVQSVEEGRRV